MIGEGHRTDPRAALLEQHPRRTAPTEVVLRAHPVPREPGRSSALDRTELALGLVLTLVILALHVAVAARGGPLWRDEVNTVNLARTPSLAAMLAHNHYDSFPVLFSIVLRGWMALGLGESDVALRSLCSLIGGGVVAALWWNARVFGARVPLLSLLLIGLSPSFLRFSNGVRAYMLGVLLLLICLGAFWRLVEAPSRKRAVVAGAAALLCVQTNFTNTAMMAGLWVSCTAMCLLRRRWKTALTLTAIEAVCVLSMLPYLAAFASHSRWNHLVRWPVGTGWMLSRLVEATDLGLPTGLMFVPWMALFCLAIGACSSRIARSPGMLQDPDARRALFLLATGLASLVFFFAYLTWLSVHMTVWYFVPLLAVMAILIEGALDPLLGGDRRAQALRAGLITVLACIVTPACWRAAQTHTTNLDVIARSLEQRAGPGDLVVVNPWYSGVTFARYYHGAAPWVTLPDVGGHQFQHYAPLLAKMGEERPIQPILGRIEETLAAGGRVWIVGNMVRLRPGYVPEDLPPSRDGGRTGPNDLDYMRAWLIEMAACLQVHAKHVQLSDIEQPALIKDYEEAALFVAEGG